MAFEGVLQVFLKKALGEARKKAEQHGHDIIVARIACHLVQPCQNCVQRQKYLHDRASLTSTALEKQNSGTTVPLAHL